MSGFHPLFASERCPETVHTRVKSTVSSYLVIPSIFKSTHHLQLDVGLPDLLQYGSSYRHKKEDELRLTLMQDHFIFYMYCSIKSTLCLNYRMCPSLASQHVDGGRITSYWLAFNMHSIISEIWHEKDIFLIPTLEIKSRSTSWHDGRVQRLKDSRNERCLNCFPTVKLHLPDCLNGTASHPDEESPGSTWDLSSSCWLAQSNQWFLPVRSRDISQHSHRHQLH